MQEILTKLSPSHAVGLEPAIAQAFRLAFPGRHPTRWAWNHFQSHTSTDYLNVAIPRGGLGTKHKFIVCIGASEQVTVAIPRGGLGTGTDKHLNNPYHKSPSHAVGLEPTGKEKGDYTAIGRHPTRWAWNSFTVIFEDAQNDMSPSHTVGLEPQITTLTKIRHINHFVKGAPFSNEVNFPKSEIMQS